MSRWCTCQWHASCFLQARAEGAFGGGGGEALSGSPADIADGLQVGRVAQFRGAEKAAGSAGYDARATDTGRQGQ